MRAHLPRLLALLGIAAAAAACNDLLVRPARAPVPVQLAVSLAPSALRSVSAAGAQAVFDRVDSVRVVLVRELDPEAALRPGVPTVLDSVLAFGPSDTVRLTVELPDSAVAAPQDLLLAILLKVRGAPVFLSAQVVQLRPNETTWAVVPLLVPVPGTLELRAERDTLAVDEETLVHATGFFATGDTIPGDLFFPSFEVLDSGVVEATPDGTRATVRAVAPGLARLRAHAAGVGATPADTVAITVRGPTGPVTPDTATFAQVVAGVVHACGRVDTGETYCWGANDEGVFGDGTTSPSPVPVAAAGGERFASISAGYLHMCGIRADGSLLCWGRNDHGQLGNRTVSGTPQLTPTAVPGGPWARVAAGYLHTCALTTAGALFCWGNNSYGQLGLGEPSEPVLAPAPVGQQTWSDLSAGGFHTCGIAQGGGAFCWGGNYYGTLGNGSTEFAFAPSAVSGQRLWSRISAGYLHTCGVEAGTGGTFCWGSNYYGQLGMEADSLIHPVPERARASTSVSSLSLGLWHTCMTHGDTGRYDCWGDDSQHALGGGLSTEGFWVEVSALHSTCGRRSGGKTFCWGFGELGQLGNGELTSSPVPVPVRAPQVVGRTQTRGGRR